MLRLCLLLCPCLAVATSLAQAPRIFKAVRSPEVADGRITFRFYAPNAKKVTLNLEGAAAPAMTRDEKGVWSGTTGPLEPDYYVYTFLVDGVQLADPANELQKSVVTGGSESLAHVPGPARLSWEENDVPHGVIHRHRFRSALIGESRDFLVYTPAAYDPASRYPVLYLLHGVMEGAGAWTEAGRVNVILDNLIAGRKAVPMIVVMPLGYGVPNVPDRVGDILTGRADQRKDIDRFGQSLFEELMPLVAKTYRVSEKRAIAGLSMGGAQALYLGLNHPERFGWVASFSGAFVMYGKPDPWFSALPKGHAPKVWIACGKDDFLFASNRGLKTWLKGKGVAFSEVETPGAHTWQVWRRNLAEYAPTLFR